MIYLGADHKGFHLKEEIKMWLRQWGLEFEDLGNSEFDEEDDYPIFASEVAKKVSDNEDSCVGIVACGSGVGVDIVANKYPLIRCGLGFGAQQIKSAREDDDINMLALPASFLSYKKAKKITEIFLKVEYEPTQNHDRRIRQILDIEKNK